MTNNVGDNLSPLLIVLISPLSIVQTGCCDQVSLVPNLMLTDRSVNSKP